MNDSQSDREAATITTTNPATGAKIKEYLLLSQQEVAQAIDATQAAFSEWRETSFDARGERMRVAAQLLREGKEALADLACTEMGKVRPDALDEVEKCASVCDYYAEHASSFLADEAVETEASSSLVSYQPIGIVLAVMPWNFPYWQVFRFAAPTLMAGNGALLKHASSVSGCALAIEDVFRRAGFPENLFQTLLIHRDRVQQVIEHRSVRAVTLTGSTAAGRTVAEQAGQNIKKTVLELGGSDPYVVLHDADIELAAEKCAQSRMVNAGQSCIAAKRFIVVSEVYDAFVENLHRQMSALTMGDPFDSDSDLGPQASENLRDELHEQVQDSIEQGAQCILGGEVPERPGAWYPPTILTDVRDGMPAYNEELFGPVAAVIRARDESDAIRIANDSDFGLGGAVFTRDIERGTEIARTGIDSGSVVVNGLVQSDPRLPFGGVKDSGYGRELSRFGIREFVNIKSVSVHS